MACPLPPCLQGGFPPCPSVPSCLLILPGGFSLAGPSLRFSCCKIPGLRKKEAAGRKWEAFVFPVDSSVHSLSFGPPSGLAGSKFPKSDQGSNPCTIQRKREVLATEPGKFPSCSLLNTTLLAHSPIPCCKVFFFSFI